MKAQYFSAFLWLLFTQTAPTQFYAMVSPIERSTLASLFKMHNWSTGVMFSIMKYQKIKDKKSTL